MNGRTITYRSVDTFIICNANAIYCLDLAKVSGSRGKKSKEHGVTGSLWEQQPKKKKPWERENVTELFSFILKETDDNDDKNDCFDIQCSCKLWW